MPIFVTLVSSTLPAGLAPVQVVRAGVPQRDGCKILGRLPAFIVPQGVPATLEHVFRDTTGRALSLLDYFLPDSESSASSASFSSPAGYSIKLRARDWLGVGLSATQNPAWEVVGTVTEAASGTVQAVLPAGLVERSGIYELSWALVDVDSTPVLISTALLSVERSMWPADVANMYQNLGPPTLQEIRMRLMDSAAAENLLLDDLEFSSEQIALALTEPVRLWNETPPPIETFTTRDFPFRGAWISGVMAQLHLMAATNYRRNRLRHQAAGVAVDDLGKEPEYLAEGRRLWDEYRAWLSNKKVEINVRKFWGAAWSSYTTRAGW